MTDSSEQSSGKDRGATPLHVNIEAGSIISRDEIVELHTTVIRPRFPSTTDKYHLREWWHDVFRDEGRYSCYAIFLVLPSDTEAFRYLNDFGRELDLISGNDCLVIALGKTEFRRSGFEDEIWGAAVKEHFSLGLSVRVAELFEVDFTDFPCLLLFQDIRSPEHVLVGLKGMTADEIANGLRSVFSVIRRAVSDRQNPIEALEHHRDAERFQKTGKSIVSGIRTFAGKTFETAMEAWIKATIK